MKPSANGNEKLRQNLDMTPAQLLDGLLNGTAPVQRRAMAKAITLLESTRADHRLLADELLTGLLPHSGRSFRLGISGVPGVGKSTFIEALGLYLIGLGHRVAVLAVDPSSTVSGGSILGDKTRMEHLSVHPDAYIRPSPSSGTLGGVAEKTREAMLVCEAAGYDVVIVETVGVGQSETAVANMTDMFCLLQLPNAGDDLQAIKKGVMEIADLVVINKADIDADAATRAEAQITSALRLLGMHSHDRVETGFTHPADHGAGLSVGPELATVRPELVEGQLGATRASTGSARTVSGSARAEQGSARAEQGSAVTEQGSARTERWHPKVVKISALLGQGVDAFWAAVTEFKTLQTANGQFALRREQQALAWMWERIEAGLRHSFRTQAAVQQLLPQLSRQVRQGQVAASTAARQLLAAYTDRFAVRAEPVEALGSSTNSPSTGSGRTGEVGSGRTGD